MYLLLNDNKYLYQIVESLLFCLVYNDKDCDLVSEINIKDDKNIYIIFSINKVVELPSKFIIYNFEQLTTEREWSELFFDKCRKAYRVFDYSLENIKIFKKHNIKVNHLPFGWCPKIDPEYTISENDKNLDIIFLACKNKRRNDILNNYGNICVYTDDKCFYNKYEDITKKAKFSFNIHYYEGNTILELTRIIPLICRGVIVISERSNDSYYDNIFKDICIFADFNDENNIKEIIKNYKFKDCILNKEKLIKKLNYVNIISKNINLF